NGNGTFGARTDFVTGNSPASVAVGDLNANGGPDLVTANSGSNDVSVLYARGGSFGVRNDYSTGSSPRAVAIGDWNGDSRPDLATANFGPSTLSVLLGNGDGSFGPRTDFGT